MELNTGALSHGLPVAVGIALAAKKRDNSTRVAYLSSPAMANWRRASNREAALVAAHYQLDNLIIINDKNNFAAGRCDQRDHEYRSAG
ncbi:hypothetical protein MJ390_08785 [Klebsiella pneumoniae]|nr:hypothetical protein MJ390_08785 [Klebsiella pneumoniae]